MRLLIKVEWNPDTFLHSEITEQYKKEISESLNKFGWMVQELWLFKVYLILVMEDP